MLLGIAPLVGLFLVSAAAFGGLLVKDYLDEKYSPKKLSRRPKEGQVVQFLYLGKNWAVKVYFENNQYSVDVLHGGEFQVHKGGFGTMEQAGGWGTQYAKERGA